MFCREEYSDLQPDSMENIVSTYSSLLATKEQEVLVLKELILLHRKQLKRVRAALRTLLARRQEHLHRIRLAQESSDHGMDGFGGLGKRQASPPLPLSESVPMPLPPTPQTDLTGQPPHKKRRRGNEFRFEAVEF